MSQPGIKYVCDRCGQMIEVGRARFVFRGELFCAYDGGTFDESPSERSTDVAAEIQRLMRVAEQRSEKDLQDEVHYPFEIDLCRDCRERVYAMLLKAERDPER